LLHAQQIETCFKYVLDVDVIYILYYISVFCQALWRKIIKVYFIFK